MSILSCACIVLCTSERCTETEHICCCGSSAHQSQGLYPQLKLWLMIWDAQHIHHQLMMFYDHVVSVSSHNMQQVSAHQAHSCACVDVLHIWVLYLTGHISCSLCTVTLSLCTCLHEAAPDELGSAAYCIIILAEMDSAPCVFGQVRPTPCDRMTGMAVSRWNGTTAIHHWICRSIVTRMAGKQSLSNQNALRHSSLTLQIQSERMASI